MYCLSIAERHPQVAQNVSQGTKTLLPERCEEEMIQRTKERNTSGKILIFRMAERRSQGL